MSAAKFPASLDSLHAIGTFVQAAADAAGLGAQARYNLRLAVDELATNAILHGHAGDGPAAQLEVRAEQDEGALTVTLVDGGSAFDPRDIPPPADLAAPLEERQIGGLGVYLALTGVDRFDYQRVGESNRNVLVMNRPRPGA